MANEPQPFVDLPNVLPVSPQAQSVLASALGESGVFRDLIVGAGGKAFHADSSGWWQGALKFADAPAKCDMAGNAAFTSILINGLAGSVIAGSIDANGNFVKQLISSNLNTQTAQILGSFTFGASGAIAIATDASNGLWLSPAGILGKKAGATTFAIDTGGNATFGGTLVACSGTFGTVTAGTFTGVNISSSNITAESITSGIITGRTLRTAAPGGGIGRSVVITGGNDQNIALYYDADWRGSIDGYTTEGSEITYLRFLAASGRYIKLKNSFIEFNGNLISADPTNNTIGSYGTKWRWGYFQDVYVDNGANGDYYVATSNGGSPTKKLNIEHGIVYDR